MTPGSTISHYTIVSKIGEGGMGVVYKAEDTKLRRIVALKFLPPNALEHRERFLREAQAAASLNHANICTVFEIDEAHGFIAMEFIDGVSVKEKIQARPLQLDEALDIALQACSGLQAAHESGIVHRDIKPANLMLTRQGQVKIMDFGLAQVEASTRITKTGASLGTPAYMSPEQVQAQPADRRSDIWSLGVLLHEMLTGRLPFPGDSEQALAFGIVHSRPEPVTALRSGLPVNLDRIIAKTLAKLPGERYQNIADLAVDLRAVSSARQSVPGKQKRFPWRPALAAALVAVLVLAGFLVWRGLGRSAAIGSLAILPLRTLAQESTESFLGLGVADALITKIGQTGQVQVRPISAVRKYARGENDPIEVARQLNAETVLEGTLQQSGDRIRVSMHLLRTATGATIWAQSFDVHSSDVFAVQDEIAKQVAGQLRLKLDASQRQDLEKRPTNNAEAFEYYSKALYHFDNRMRRDDELKMAIELSRKAVELDPNYALAHAQLGHFSINRGVYFSLDPEDLERGRLELDEAEKLDPRIAQIHVARSIFHYSQHGHWNLRDAVLEMKTALRLDPNGSHNNLAYYYWHIGLEALAAKHDRAALQADPNSTFLREALSGNFYMSLLPDQGADIERNLFHRSPDVEYYLAKGMTQEAEPLLAKAFAGDPKNMRTRLRRAQLFAQQGKSEAARAEIAAVESYAEKAPRTLPFHHIAYGIAQVRAKLGEAAKALRWLEITVDTGWPQYPMMERDHMLDPVRQDPAVARFLAALKTTFENNRIEFGDEGR